MVFLVIFHVLVIVLGPFIFGDMMGMLERAVTVLVEADSLVPMVSCYALTIYESILCTTQNAAIDWRLEQSKSSLDHAKGNFANLESAGFIFTMKVINLNGNQEV